MKEKYLSLTVYMINRDIFAQLCEEFSEFEEAMNSIVKQASITTRFIITDSEHEYNAVATTIKRIEQAYDLSIYKYEVTHIPKEMYLRVREASKEDNTLVFLKKYTRA